MKKLLVVFLTLMMLAACSATPAVEEPEEEVVMIKVALLVGNLGDLSFNDSAERGVRQAEAEFDDVTVTTIEYGTDAANFEPTILDTADAGYDIIIVSSGLKDLVDQYAPDYPEIDFFMFDAELVSMPNTYSIMYKANEASYLGGFLAAKLSTTGVIAFLGGADISVISDFLVGYIEGAQFANPDIKVTTAYGKPDNPWGDPATGKELALTMFAQGADVIFNVAGGTGIGGIEAAAEKGFWALGVDSDQAMIYDADGKTDFADAIVSSVLKNVDYSLYRAISMYREGTLPLGTTETLGIAEGGVGLADNKYFQANVSEDVRAEITSLEDQITAGGIKITTAYGLTAEEISAIREAVKP